MSPAATAYLGKRPAVEMYLVHVAGGTGGKSSSQLAETGNSTLKDMREQQFAVGLLTHIQTEMDRLTRNALSADAADCQKDVITPTHRADLNKAAEFRDKNGWNYSVKWEGTSTKCTVTSITDPSQSFHLDLSKPGSCSCGESVTLAKPCIHEMYAARSKNQNAAEVYPSESKTLAWKATYTAMVSATPITHTHTHTPSVFPLRCSPNRRCLSYVCQHMCTHTHVACCNHRAT